MRYLAIVGALWPALAAAEGRLAEFLPRVAPADLIAGADRFGTPEGSPPVAPIYQGDRLLGFAYLNSDVVDAAGYSGKPIHIIVALDTEGRIAGARLMDHHEPIVLVGIPEEKIRKVIDHFRGTDVRAIVSGSVQPSGPDIVSGATVTVLVIGDSILRSALKVLQARSIGQPLAGGASAPQPTLTLDQSKSEVRDWQSLLGDGSVRRLQLTIGDVNDAFARSGNAKAAARPERGQRDEIFVDLYVALATVPTIGRSLLGDVAYKQLTDSLKPGQQAIMVMGEGRYSFKGSGYVRGGIFDRIELVQGLESVRFKDKSYTRIGDLAAADAPRFKEIGLFVLPEDTAFDSAKAWQLKLLVQRATGALEKTFLTFDLGYTAPVKYFKGEPGPAETPVAATSEPQAAASPLASGEPLWLRIWRDKLVEVGVLAAALLLLTAIFFFQDWLMKRPVLFGRLRLGFLAFSLFWLGWLVHAQPSVVNVLTYVNALMTGFKWDYFLMDPLLFVLWSSIAAALLFWGRGPFCGWLCPFGALQEFVNRIARLIKVPQLTVPWGVHERLWPVKYIIFLGLFGVSLYSLALGEQLSEVEPFKTAIVLRFMRDWPFVVFAGALLVAGLFVERFFCRYLCPLGAALAIPGRLRMFDWLKRYRECGSPCQRCANECPVQAIRPEGQINVNECIYCMHCQLLYWDDHKCPVMIQRRLKREKREAMASPSMRTTVSRASPPEPAAQALPSP